MDFNLVVLFLDWVVYVLNLVVLVSFLDVSGGFSFFRNIHTFVLISAIQENDKKGGKGGIPPLLVMIKKIDLLLNY